MRYRHGLSKTPEYRVWQQLRDRCRNPSNKKFYLYGARGVTVCARWDNFSNFLEDMGPRPRGATIERVNSDKGYCPENCKWATYTEQNRNTSRNSMITFEGVTRCASEWAEITGLTRYTVANRIRRGWSVKKALTTPQRKYPKHIIRST